MASMSIWRESSIIERGVRDTGALIAKLRLRLIDSSGARPNTRANIGKPDGFQETLDGAIFAVLAMESQKGNVEITLNQSQQVFLVGRVENGYRKARLEQSFLRPSPEAKGNGALAALASRKQSNTNLF